MTKNVLIVEDDPNMLVSLKFLMKGEGYAVRVAEDGEAALAAIQETPPDLILLDLMIPKRDGYEVCQTVRANQSWKDVRIIILTARSRDSEREKGVALGADDYITKPFANKDLIERVHAALNAASG